MKRRKNTIQWTVLLLACGALGWFAFAEDKPKPAKNEIPPIAFPADGRIDFEKHVQPILVAACYECHSAKKIKGKFRLDAKELAMKGGSTGVAIMPGKGESSYLVKRLRGEGDEDRMPLDHDPLTDEQIRIIETWIDQGAVWPDRASVKVEKHWAYVKPVRPELPKVKNEKWARNGIDYFVLARLEKEGLSPSPEADKEHLLRRVSLDLTGLPPSPEEVSAFLLDERPDAYERAVDRLLDSPHYGERWGRHWLDIARYADSNGYEKDAPRVIWAYRDWVINALNRDLPFDQFIIEQFAGDMLPDATPQQRIATGFHRNTMINEEGGIDVEEFRDKAIVDRVQTTATGLLGLTLQCANCHDHKYDQFSQKEYYQFWALLNNADEPVFNVPDPQIAKRRAEIEAKIAQAESELESKFPAQDEPIVWEVVNADDFDSAGGAILSRLPDNSLLASGRNAGTDTYTVKATINPKEVSHIRLEALTHPSLAKNGPGRAGADGNGNFVLTEFRVTAAEGGADVKPVALVDAQAAVQQSGFAAAAAIDGNPQTGWAVDDGSGKINENRTIIFKLKEPIAGEKVQLTFTVEQTYPTHPMGRFKLSLGRPQPVPPTNIPVEEQRKLLLAMRMEAWEKQVAPKCVKWTVLEPTKFSRNYGGSITKLNDNSLLFTGDNYYRDEYKLEYQSDMKGITVLRLEVLPHEDQPKGGPGRDPEGGFVLSEFAVNAGPVGKPEASQPVEFEKATAETATPPTIQKAIDGKRDTHWIINPRGDAKPRVAVFRLKTPIGNDEGTRLAVSILQNYHQQANLGRVRISATTDTRGVEAAGVPGEIEEILITPADQRSPAQLEQLKKYFLTITPLLAEQRKQIANLKNSLPKYVTTLVLQERPVPRVTKVHHRGDFLNQREAVEPGVPGVLPTLPEGAPKNRLTLAKWLVDENHPLVGRVVMNRIWSHYFGRGIVYTVEDFGVMGQRPTHPELLDWLATEFPRQKWSMKAIHRLIVTSATYRQSSRVTPSLRERDPDNILLARGPRMRVEAEIVRDIALTASGLLSHKIGGPSVYPPQPPGIGELSYGPIKWVTSPGEDRYRRGMYTFFKRTSPYPGLTVFDAPSSELVCARRIRSNTPLQALTVLNDQVFVEAAQAMALRVMREAEDDEARAARAVRLCLSRKPDSQELAQIVAFYQAQLERFKQKGADPVKVALADPDKAPKGIDMPELAAWTTVCRAILNLDETVTKE